MFIPRAYIVNFSVSQIDVRLPFVIPSIRLSVRQLCLPIVYLPTFPLPNQQLTHQGILLFFLLYNVVHVVLLYMTIICCCFFLDFKNIYLFWYSEWCCDEVGPLMYSCPSIWSYYTSTFHHTKQHGKTTQLLFSSLPLSFRQQFKLLAQLHKHNILYILY